MPERSDDVSSLRVERTCRSSGATSDFDRPCADATEDRPIARRHLLRHQAEPCSEVTPFGKGSAITNGRHLLRSR